MKILTPITEMLKVDLPIFAAPMFLVSYPELVVSVSEAGGVGCFPTMNYRTPEKLNSAIGEICEKTQKPIGVNIVLHKGHNPQWPKQLEIVLKNNIKLIIGSLGISRSVVNEAKSIGAKVFYDVTTLRYARIAEKAGVNGLIAVAQGAGGHAGAISPFSLIPYLKEETSLPIIAAGGINSGNQMAAAFALGADAVYMGTRFIASEEASASKDYKEMILNSTPEEIIYTSKISGIPANWLKKSLDKMDKIEEKSSLDERKRWKDIWSAGHGVGEIKSILPAGEIVRNVAKEYLNVINSRFPKPLSEA